MPTAPNMSAVHSKLEYFFVAMLQEAYWSEQNLIDVLNTMSQAATTEELRQSFKNHMEETKTHVSRLQKVFTMMGIPAQAEPCAGLQGLFDEGWQVIDETEQGSAQRDVALIIAAQKVEHYEIACYGSMVTLAKTMERTEIAEVLGQTLVEEKETDAMLTEIAEGKINFIANEEPVC